MKRLSELAEKIKATFVKGKETTIRKVDHMILKDKKSQNLDQLKLKPFHGICLASFF